MSAGLTDRDSFTGKPDSKGGDQKTLKSGQNGSEVVGTRSVGAGQFCPSVGLYLSFHQCGHPVFIYSLLFPVAKH